MGVWTGRVAECAGTYIATEIWNVRMIRQYWLDIETYTLTADGRETERRWDKVRLVYDVRCTL